MADNCYVVEPLPSDNLPRTPFRRAVLSRSHYNLRGPKAPRNPLGLLFYFPLFSPRSLGQVARRTLLRVAFRLAPRKRIQLQAGISRLLTFSQFCLRDQMSRIRHFFLFFKLSLDLNFYKVEMDTNVHFYQCRLTLISVQLFIFFLIFRTRKR